MRALSTRNEDPSHASRPFDKERDGFILAEGGAVVVLESLDHALARGARIYAEVEGYGTTSNAYHMTAPDPCGDQTARAFRLALEDARPKTSRRSASSSRTAVRRRSMNRWKRWR